MRIVLGGQDTIIKAKDNMAFFAQNVAAKTDYAITIKSDLAHQIPVAIFKEETKAFFKALCY